MNTLQFDSLLQKGLTGLFVCVQLSSMAQNVVLETQTDVDAFDQNTLVIDGDLRIDGSDIVNLNALSNLTSVNGDVIIMNTTIQDVNGLNNLSNIGNDLILEENNSILNLNELANLEQIGGSFFIAKNEILENINGLEELATIDGVLDINLCDSLQQVYSFPNLDSINGGINFRTTSLLDLDWLEGVDLKGQLRIASNKNLKNLNGLLSFTNVDDLSIGGNPMLTSVAGLRNIEETKYNFNISGNQLLENIDSLPMLTMIGGDMVIQYNPKLKTVSGFDVLEYIGQSLRILGNNELEDINGLSSLREVKNSLTIEDNPKLSECCGIRYLLDNSDIAVGQSISIEDNAPNCNSVEEILEDTSPLCLVSTTDGSYSLEYNISPNPFQDEFRIDISGGKIVRLSLSDIHGRIVKIDTSNKNIIDTKFLSSGLFVLDLLMDDGSRITTKLVKK